MIKICRNLQRHVRQGSFAPFTQPLPMLTSCTITVQYRTQETDIGTNHRAYHMSLCVCVCVCVCSSMQFYPKYNFMWGFPGGMSGREPACQCRTCRRSGFDPYVRKILWRRVWQPTLVLVPGESHGQSASSAKVHGVAKSGTRLKWQSMHAHT